MPFSYYILRRSSKIGRSKIVEVQILSLKITSAVSYSSLGIRFGLFLLGKKLTKARNEYVKGFLTESIQEDPKSFWS